MDRVFLAVLISFVCGLFVFPLVIRIIRKIKANQTIYEYVDMHKAKSGTPTMGGIGIILSAIIGFFCVSNSNIFLAILSVVLFLVFGILGFLDDFIKVAFKRNLGLRAYQKIIGQISIALIVSIFAYKSNLVGSVIFVPFSGISFDLGFWYIPITMLVILCVTNSVNLTDGLDGLAGGTSLAFLVGFIAILFVLLSKGTLNLTEQKILEFNNILVLCGGGAGALLCYLIFNCKPALCFMGDTGSLALGGLISAVTIFTGQFLLIPILGVMFVVSCISVIIQVVYFKFTKKRVFLMAPYHHHLEKKGWNENRIVFIYIIITIIISVCGTLLTLILN